MQKALLAACVVMSATFSRFRHRWIVPIGRVTTLARNLNASAIIPRDIAKLPAFPEAAK